MVNNFVNSFWDPDWNGTKGYEAIVTRLKDGKKLYDAYSEFVRSRAKLEDEYGKNLIKLAQIAAGNEEMGTLRQSWDSIKKETENIGSIHCDLSKQLNDLADRALHFREKQKRERLTVDDSMRREQKEKQACHENMQKAKRLYEQRCKESDAANEAYKAKSSYTPKEDEKLKKNKQKCKTVVESTDSSYQHSVKQLEDLRQKYISSMEDACAKFQTIEEGRIQFLRNEMWLYTNNGSAQTVNTGERYEECRKILEKCNEKQDMQLFINSSHTGSTRPSPIVYENYYHKGKTHFNTNVNTPAHPENKSSNINIAKLLSPSPNLISDRTVHTSTNPNHLVRNTAQHAQAVSAQHAQQAAVSVGQLVEVDNNSSIMLAQAAFMYQSQGDQELSLNPGDVIEIVNMLDETWGVGTLHGKVGVFPLAFVDIIQQH